MSTRKNDHMDALAEKFRNYRPESSKSDYAVFEAIEKEGKATWIALETLLMLLVIALILNGVDKGFVGMSTAWNKMTSTHQSEKPISSESGEIKEQTNTPYDQVPDVSIESDAVIAKDSGTDKLESTVAPTREENISGVIQLDNSTRRGNDPQSEHAPGISDNGNAASESTDSMHSGQEGQLELLTVKRKIPTDIEVNPEEIMVEELVTDPPLKGKIPPLNDKTNRGTGIDLAPALSFSYGVSRTSQIIQAKENADTYVPSAYSAYSKDALQPAIKFFTNVDFELPLFASTLLSGGLNISQYGTSGNYNHEVDSFPVYDLDGSIAGYLHGSESVKVDESSARTYTYVQIPVGLIMYYGLTDKYRLSVGANVSLSYLVQSKGHILDETDYTAVRSMRNMDTRKINLNVRAELGLMRSINDHWSVGGRISFDRMMRSDQINTYYEVKNYGVGIAFSTRYRFTKK